MPPAALQELTPDNTTIIMIDFAVAFGPIARSHDLLLHRNNVLLLADTALTYGSGLVVTNGPDGKASGPLYPELLEVLGDHPVVVRGGMFNAFLYDPFKASVADAGRPNLVVAGLTTEGCVLQTVLGGLRDGYNVFVAEDTSAGQSRATHDAAIARMAQAGATPLTAFSLTAEFQVDQSRPNVQDFVRLTGKYNPDLTMEAELFQYGQHNAA